MDWTKALNELGGASKLIEDCVWDYETGRISQGIPEMDSMDTKGKCFYTSSYICPRCNRFMLKANVGEYVSVRTIHGAHKLKSTFACDNCKMFYSARIGQNLSQGNYYVMRDKNKYQRIFETIDNYGVSMAQLQRLGW